jgi:hypothetical protein
MNEHMRLGFNTWDGCGDDLDGTFQDDYCRGKGPIYTAPGEPGEPVTVYYALKTGLWAEGGTFEFNLLVDNLSLKWIP